MLRFRLIGIAFVAFMVPMTAVADDKPTPLFNGKDLTGWRTYVDPKAKTATPAKDLARIENGVMIVPGEVMGGIITNDEYENYTLSLEWKWGEKVTKARNSGVLVHVSGPDSVWPKSIEAQLAAGKAGDLWVVSGFKADGEASRKDPKTGRRYFRSKNDIEKPIGEWNRYDITCKNNTVTLAVNGEVVNVAQNTEANKGKILLQSEGAEIHFRNIVLKAAR